MKISAALTTAYILLAAATSCSTAATSPADDIAAAEQAYEHGHYLRAQAVADSVLNNVSPEKLGATSLCRLSLLLMRIGEASGEIETSTASAAHALDAAIKCDSDSTHMFINNLSAADRAQLMLVSAVTDGSRHAATHGICDDADEESITENND